MNYATSAEEVVWGITLVAITMAIHGCGMVGTLFGCHLIRQGSGVAALSFVRGGSILILASWMIVLVHLCELLVWAAFFLWQNALPDASNSYYFALMQYTTVGSEMKLPARLRLLEGMLPIAGLMTFAWSTGILFTLAQEFQAAQVSALHRRREARNAARHASKPRPVGHSGDKP